MAYHLIFSGQGAQQVGMGRDLHEASSQARERYREASEILGWDIADISFNGPESALTETRICQPALYVQGYCIAEWLLSEGGLSVPDLRSAFGLSLGELTALAVAGTFDFSSGLRIVAERGRLMQLSCEATQGGMAALIGGNREAAESLARDFGVDVANLNCPGQIVLSGDAAAIEKAISAAPEAGFRMAKALNVAGAYHSRLMEPAARDFREFLKGIVFEKPHLSVYTNTTGRPVEDPDEIRAALVRQVTGSVFFEDNLRNAVADSGCTEFLECGPGGVLAGFIKRIDRSWATHSLPDFDALQTFARR